VGWDGRREGQTVGGGWAVGGERRGVRRRRGVGGKGRSGRRGGDGAGMVRESWKRAEKAAVRGAEEAGSKGGGRGWRGWQVMAGAGLGPKMQKKLGKGDEKG
jgi:hypothetical protein